MYHVSVKRVRATAVEKQSVLYILSARVRACVCVCVCSLRHPACNAHAPYCHLWPTRLYNNFSHYLINGTIFDKKITELKICFDIFFLQILPETFHILRKTGRDIFINVY